MKSYSINVQLNKDKLLKKQNKFTLSILNKPNSSLKNWTQKIMKMMKMKKKRISSAYFNSM